ncbi:MAG: hypothetical protein IT366_03715 [Candidatus Hydrogenedentes bacterium]|nr:hypothetical protein [Candidatus Hydrogenedentota bacterium]
MLDLEVLEPAASGLEVLEPGASGLEVLEPGASGSAELEPGASGSAELVPAVVNDRTRRILARPLFELPGPKKEWRKRQQAVWRFPMTLI